VAPSQIRGTGFFQSQLIAKVTVTISHALEGDGVQQSLRGEVYRVYRFLKNWILQCEFRPSDFLAEVERRGTARSAARQSASLQPDLARRRISRIGHKGYAVISASILKCWTASSRGYSGAER
jgi:hypothetical protein